MLWYPSAHACSRTWELANVPTTEHVGVRTADEMAQLPLCLLPYQDMYKRVCTPLKCGYRSGCSHGRGA